MEIHIVDDFLPNPDEARDEILDVGKFEGIEVQGHFYNGVDLSVPLEVLPQLDEIHGREVDPVAAFWRLTKPGEKTPSPIHPDTIFARWAGVLYMTPTDEMGGTAFWKHKESGDHFFPPRKRLSRDQSYVDMIVRDGGDESKWDMTMLVKAQYNRFVTYPTHYYHSRYPFTSDNYGETNETARLIWVVFYDI